MKRMELVDVLEYTVVDESPIVRSCCTIGVENTFASRPKGSRVFVRNQGSLCDFNTISPAVLIDPKLPSHWLQ